jgi:hypothetical protein
VLDGYLVYTFILYYCTQRDGKHQTAIHSATYQNQYNRANKMQCSLSVYYELKASACFQQYLLIIRRHGIYNWYIVCVLCRAAAS